MPLLRTSVASMPVVRYLLPVIDSSAVASSWTASTATCRRSTLSTQPLNMKPSAKLCGLESVGCVLRLCEDSPLVTLGWVSGHLCALFCLLKKSVLNYIKHFEVVLYKWPTTIAMYVHVRYQKGRVRWLEAPGTISCRCILRLGTVHAILWSFKREVYI